MGRSVATHTDAVHNIFFDVPTAYYEDEDGGQHEDEYITEVNANELWEEIKEALLKKFPSLIECDEWDPYNEEVHCLLKNDHAFISRSEYCGLISMSLAFNRHSDNEGLAKAWCNKVVKSFEETVGEFTQLYYRDGRMSDGTSIYKADVK